MRSELILISIVTIFITWTEAFSDYVGGRRVWLANDKQNWFTASDICRSHDKELLEIHSGLENEEAYALLKKYNIDEAWIGLNDLGKEDLLVWSSSGRRALNTFWAQSSYDGKGDEQDCMTISTYLGHRDSWFDRKCTDTFKYVCQERTLLH